MTTTYEDLVQYKIEADLKIDALQRQIQEQTEQIEAFHKMSSIYKHLLDISDYINHHIKNQNFFSVLADMFVGVFGAKYVSIYACDHFGEYHMTTNSDIPYDVSQQEKALISKHNNAFIVGQNDPLYQTIIADYIVYSCIGVPIVCDECRLGFILIHHTLVDQFTPEHQHLLSTIANYVGIALQNNISYRDITEKANKDALTGLYNRRYFFDHTSKDRETPYAIVMADIDNFKVVNDTYGHPYGDVVLQNLARIIKQHTTEDDIVARYGGEEIILFLDNIQSPEQLLDRLEMIRTVIAATRITSKGVSQSVTLSLGAYLNTTKTSVSECISIADKNLYISKATGKNKCTIS